MIHKSTLMVATAAIMSVALVSAQLPAQASINPAPVVLDIESEKTVSPSPEVAPMRLAWSIKGAAKKVGRGLKKAGKAAGRGIRKANRVIMPSEIRNGASKAYREIKRGVKYIIKHPYGKRCKPTKFLLPECKVGPTKRRVRTHNHRR